MPNNEAQNMDDAGNEANTANTAATGTKKEVLTITIDITGSTEVKGKTGTSVMISFSGTADGELFHGKTISEGVDTQKEWYGSVRTLSARYVLEGIDYTGKECHIFVENNGEIIDGVITTTPKIFTDSEALAFLETAKLKGTATWSPQLTIHIFEVK